MIRVGRPLFAAGLTLALGALLWINLTQMAQAKVSNTTFTPHPLIGATLQDVGDYAVNYTRSQFKVLSGVPQVRLAMPVTSAQLPDLGLNEIDFPYVAPPLTLVILEGDFDVTGAPVKLPEGSGNRVRFIGYVFDLYAGAPTVTEFSRMGGRFRTALGDPTLPSDVWPAHLQVTPVQGTEPPPRPVSSRPARTPVPYGYQAEGMGGPVQTMPPNQ